MYSSYGHQPPEARTCKISYNENPVEAKDREDRLCLEMHTHMISEDCPRRRYEFRNFEETEGNTTTYRIEAWPVEGSEACQLCWELAKT